MCCCYWPHSGESNSCDKSSGLTVIFSFSRLGGQFPVYQEMKYFKIVRQSNETYPLHNIKCNMSPSTVVRSEGNNGNILLVDVLEFWNPLTKLLMWDEVLHTLPIILLICP